MEIGAIKLYACSSIISGFNLRSFNVNPFCKRKINKIPIWITEKRPNINKEIDNDFFQE